MMWLPRWQAGAHLVLLVCAWERVSDFALFEVCGFSHGSTKNPQSFHSPETLRYA